MGKSEEIENEKKLWESDEAWELRKAFLEAHYDDYPKMQLQCLSQLFINITLLGCDYSETLMTKIKEMGSGISAAMDRQKSGHFVKASAAKKREAVKISDLQGNEDSKRSKTEESVIDHEAFNEKLDGLKIALGMTPHHLTGKQMMNAAATSSLMRWRLNKTASKIEIYIDRFLALQHTFSLYCVDPEESALNALIESILACQPVIKDLEVSFNDQPATMCYANSISRSFGKIKTNLATQTKLSGLSKCLEAVNMSLLQNAKKLEGWSQQLDIVAGDMLLASRVLSSEECTRPAMAVIADEMAASICEKLTSGSFNVILKESSHSSLSFAD